jgi:hypothetical protein
MSGNPSWSIVASSNGKSSMRSVVITGSVVIHQAYQKIQDFKKFSANGQYIAKSGLDIPLGASATQVKEIGKQIFKRWGEKGLERITKMHFKTVQEILMEAK